MENASLSLNQRLSLIGFQISYSESDQKLTGRSIFEYDIEETLLLASYDAEKDFRLLSLLATWISVHGDYVIVEKFFKKLKEFEKYRGHRPGVINLLAAQATSTGKTKWKKWITCSRKNPEYPVDKDLLKSSIEFHGVNQDLDYYGVLVPKKFLRIREDDVLSTEELARSNKQFRNRLMYGASWRADIITAIEAGFKNPSAIARTLGCSYEPSHRIFKEFTLALTAST